MDAQAIRIRPVLKEKECEICGTFFMQTKNTQRFCPECRRQPAKKMMQLNYHISESIKRSGTGRDPVVVHNICAYCGRNFSSVNRRLKFCSRQCKDLFEKEKVKCTCCGKPWKDSGLPMPKSTQKWYCSERCREIMQWENAKKKGSIQTCSFCGKEFIRKKEGKFCSQHCYHEALKLGWRPEKVVPPKEPALKIRCSYCGKICETTAPKKDFLCLECRVAASEKKYKQKKEKKERKEEQAYVEKNGLCSICRTPYAKCERMMTDFRVSPAGASFKDSLVIQCPKFKK